MGFFADYGPKGTGGERKAPSAPAGAYPLPRRGMTRRLRRGLGLAVPRGAHTFLSVAKEKCAKESQRHGDSGKKPFIAHFDGGARYVARSGVGQITHAIVRARSSPFSAVKMGGPFSLRCLSPLCSGAVGGGQAYPLRGFCFRHSGCGAVLPLAGEKGFCGLAVLPRKEQSLLLPRSWRGATLPLAGEWDSVAWPISGGHRPAGLAVCTRHPAGSRTRPASREACRRAAVKPRPSRMSPERPARLWRAVRGAGAARGSACPVDTTAAGGSRPAAVNRNEDLTRQCQRRRLRLRTSTPACGAGGRRRRREGSEAAGRREGRRPWSGCLRSGRGGRRWRP